MSIKSTVRAAGRVLRVSLEIGGGESDLFRARVEVNGDSRASDAEYALCKGPIGVVPVVGVGVGNGCCLVIRVGRFDVLSEGIRPNSCFLADASFASRELEAECVSFRGVKARVVGAERRGGWG